MTLYVVRHGETEGNLGKFHQTDATPLTKNGLNQAKKLAQRFTHTHIDTIIASPTVRTRQTASEIAQVTQADITFDERFKEKRNPSMVANKPYSDTLKTVWDTIFSHFDDPKFHHSDEENAWDFIARVSSGFQELEKRKETSIVLVTHGFVVRTIVGLVTFGPMFSSREFRHMIDHFETNNTGITVLRSEEVSPGMITWRVITVNDHAHLLE